MTAKLRIVKQSFAVAAAASEIAFNNFHESKVHDFHLAFCIRRAPPSVSSAPAKATAANIRSARKHPQMNIGCVHLSAYSEVSVANRITTNKNINAPAGACIRDCMTKVFQNTVENKSTIKNYYQSTRRAHPFGKSGPRFFTR